MMRVIVRVYLSIVIVTMVGDVGAKITVGYKP